jgi:adenylate cyclase class IV
MLVGDRMAALFYRITAVQNLEFKARCADLDRAGRVAEGLGAVWQWKRSQTDTYFHAPQGKLKLREVEGQPAELIAYHRSAAIEVRESDYLIYYTERADALKATLAMVMGVDRTVRKVRTLYLYHHVRIHLDRVEALGSFIEFEAVISRPEQIEPSRLLLDEWIERFAIKEADRVAVGYYELQNMI